VKHVDMTRVEGVHQVLLQVRVAEVSRNALRALDINSFFAGDKYFGSVQTGGFNPVDIGVPDGAPVGRHLPFEFLSDSGATSAATLFMGFPRADLQIVIRALEENRFLRILAEPNLVALSGEEASFLAGGEFPIPVVQSGTGVGQSISIEFREFGVSLRFRPHVLGENLIRLRVAPEVTDLSDIGSVEIEGFRIPGIQTRRAETTLELRSGQSFGMAGLLNQRSEARNTKIPLLGDLPVLGPLFRSVRYERGETELVVLVTASLVEPQSLATVPPLPGTLHVMPNDWELFAKGQIEGAQPPMLAPADQKHLQQLGLDRLKGPGAWIEYGTPPVAPQPTPVEERPVKDNGEENNEESAPEAGE
jgi:pilus assembly protein CpaC